MSQPNCLHILQVGRSFVALKDSASANRYIDHYGLSKQAVHLGCKEVHQSYIDIFEKCKVDRIGFEHLGLLLQPSFTPFFKHVPTTKSN
jgi:hypothetical protein